MQPFVRSAHRVWRGWLALSSERNRRAIERTMLPLIEAQSEQFQRESDSEVLERIEALRQKLMSAARAAPRNRSLLTTDEDRESACTALALARVLVQRTLAIWLHRNQLVAAVALAQGYVIQLDTGEGKTFVGALRAYLDYLWGYRATIVVPNGYLAARDARNLRDFFEVIGARVGCANGDDGHGQNPGAYHLEVCYVSLDRLMFDHVTHVTCKRLDDWVDLPLESVILDEIDAVLLDGCSYGHAVQLRTHPEVFVESNVLVKRMQPREHFESEPSVTITELGSRWIAGVLDYYPRLAALVSVVRYFHVRCALEAHHRYREDVDYILSDGRIVLINRQTGRPESGKSLGIGVHQAVEVRHSLDPSPASQFVYTIQPASVFNRAKFLCGMSGSTAAERVTLRKVFGLPVMIVPPNRPSQRRVLPPLVCKDRAEQVERAAQEAVAYIKRGQPVLVCTQTILDADLVSSRMAELGVRVKQITAKNAASEADVMRFAGESGAATVAARMAARGVDIIVDEAGRAAGGLVILGVGCFSYSRLDEQLAGRTGRQGAAGEVRFILSLSDEMFSGLPEFSKRLVSANWDSALADSPAMRRSYLTQQRRYQMSERDSKLARLSWDIRRDEVLDEVRTNFEDFRKRLLMLADTRGFIRDLFGTVLDLPEAARSEANPLARFARNGDGTNRSRTIDDIWEAYQERKLAAGPAGDRRERTILLRCLDFQWSMLFIDWSRHCELSDQYHGGVFLDQQFLRQRERVLKQEYALQAVHYLLSIDEDQVLSRCYYWRGTLIPMSGAPRGTGEGSGEAAGTSEPEEEEHESEVPENDPWDGVSVPEDQRYVSESGATPEEDESRHFPAKRLTTDESSEIPQLRALTENSRRILRWANVSSTIFGCVLGALCVTGLMSVAGTFSSLPNLGGGLLPLPMLRGVATLAGAPFDGPWLAFSVGMLALILGEELGGFLKSWLACWVVVQGAVLFDLWSGAPWVHLLYDVLWSAGALLTFALLQTSDLKIREIACPLATIWVWPSVVTSFDARSRLLCAAAGIGVAAICLICGRVRLDLRTMGGWEEVRGEGNQARRKYVIPVGNDLWPWLAAAIWATCLIAVAPLLGPSHAVSARTIWTILFGLGLIYLGCLRDRVQFGKESFQEAAWTCDGVFESRGKALSIESAAAIVRARSLIVWTALAVIASCIMLALLLSADTHILWLVLMSSLLGASVARWIHIVRSRYSGWYQPVPKQDPPVGAMKARLRKTLQSLSRQQGRAWFWGPALASAVLAQLAQTLL